MTLKNTLRLSLILSIASITSLAFADDLPSAKPAAVQTKEVDPAPAKDQPLQKVEVKGSSETYDARRNDTATKIVVTQEEILKNGDLTIGEVLKRLPGVTVNGGIRMRGLGNGYTQILLNGEPSPPGFSLESLSPDMIERIEIMRAATAEFSTQAIAGTINIVLKKAIVTAQREFKTGLYEEGGHAGASANFQLSDKNGPYSYAVGGGLNYARFGSPSLQVESASNAQGVPTVLRATSQVFAGRFLGVNVAPRLNWTASPNDTITSQSYLNFNRFQGQSLGATAVEIGVAPPLVKYDFSNDNSAIIAGTNLNWIHKMEHGAKLDMKIGGSYNHRDANSGGTQFDSSNALALITTTSSTSSDKNLTASGKFSTPIVEGHALATGWDGAFSKRDEVRLTTEVSPTGLIPQNIDEALRACVRRLALFAQDEWNVTARWSVYFGLRWEGIETIAGATGLADIENRSSVWSPLFQTLWKLPDSKADQLRFALTRTYKAPNTGSLVPRHYSSRENTPTTPDYQGNPNLKPELAWGLDLGLEHFIEGGGVLSGSTFARRIDDITHQQTTLIGDRWVSMIGNGGVANTYGIEMDFKLPLRSVDKTAPNIDLRANMTRSWSSLSTVPGPNNRLDSQTPFSGTIGADYKMDGTGPLSTGASYSFQGAGAVRTSFNQYGWSRPRRSLDMYAAWKFDPKNQLRVSISNLLHQTSITENSYVDTNGVAGRRSESPSTTTLRAIMEIKL